MRTYRGATTRIDEQSVLKTHSAFVLGRGTEWIVFAASALLLMALLWWAPFRMDEVWCFAFTNRIAQGYLPYKDFNLILPPFFFWLGVPFSGSLLAYRVLGALIGAGIVALTRAACSRHGLSSVSGWLMTAGSFILVMWYPDANYNLFLVFLFLLAYSLAEKALQSKKALDSGLVALVLSAALITKQSAGGVALLLIAGIYLAGFVKKEIPLRNLVYFCIGSIAVPLLFLGTLIFTDSFGDFVGDTVLGLGSFTGNFTLEKDAIPFLAVSLLLTGLLLRKAFRPGVGSWNLSVAIALAAAGWILMLPIVDGYHGLVLCILLIGMLPLAVKGSKLKASRALLVLLPIFLILAGAKGWMIVSSPGDGYVRMPASLTPYQHILFPKGLANEVQAVADYIQLQEEGGQDVAVISPVAYLYILPAGDYNGYLDLIAKGNTGIRPTEEILAQAYTKDILLVKKAPHWQERKDVREAIMKDCRLIGEVGGLWIYQPGRD